MMFKKVILLYCLMFFALSSVSAQEEQVVLSLEKAISLALETSEALQISESNAQKSREIYKEARSALLPGINADATWARNTTYPLSSKKEDYELDSGVTATQLIWSFGQVSGAVKAAEKAADSLRYNKDLTRRQVIYNTKLSYYAAILARDTFHITQQSYDNVLAHKKLLEKRAFGGRTSKRDRLKMDADIASRLPPVNNARAQMDTAMQTLKTLTDIRPGQEISLSDDFSLSYKDVDYSCLESRLYEQEPYLKVLNKNLEAAEFTVKSKKAVYYPVLSAFASWRYAGSSNDQRYIGDKNSDHYAAGGLQVSLPLWNGGEKTAQLHQALADRRKALLARKKGEEDLLLELRNAVSEYDQYRKTLEANDQAVSLAKESLLMTQDMFEAGQVDLTELNDAELLLTGQRLNREITLYNIHFTLARIEKLTSEE